MYGYSPEVVRFSYQSTLDYYAALGIELSQADREQLAPDTRSRRKACVPMPKTCMRAYGRACIRN